MPELRGKNEDYQLYRKMSADYHRENTEALRNVERDRATAAAQQSTDCDQGTIFGLRIF